jgi:hypothetical protein
VFAAVATDADETPARRAPEALGAELPPLCFQSTHFEFLNPEIETDGPLSG